MKPAANPTDVISKYAAILSLVEVGLGSLLHAFKIPLSGQFLSLNQGFLLTRATLEAQTRTTANSVSAVAALLKSLSPAGKKLTPMLAISSQGLLFSLGVLLFGINSVGLIVGMILLCLWAFVQPVLIYLLLYGKTAVDVTTYFFEQLQSIVTIEMEHIYWSVIALVGLKILMGTILVFMARKLPDEHVQVYLKNLERLGRSRLQKNAKMKVSSPLRLALRDLFTPLFVGSLVMTGVFFFVTQQETSTIVWGFMRPIAFGFIIFYTIRVLPFEKILAGLNNTKLQGFANSVQNAVKSIKQIELK